IEGKVEGRVEGKVEGKIEEKEEVVERCWRKKMDIKDIAEISGLTVDEVIAIIKKLEEKEDKE
ncbi:MAG: transposase, partial [Bacteroidota bacterium]